MKAVKLIGYKRENAGTKYAAQLRAEGKVPCVLYGGKDHVIFSAYEADFTRLVYTPDVHIADLDIDGQNFKAVLKDIQFHPVNEAILHVDFLQVIDDKPITIDIPVKITGTSPGVREGGKLLIKARKLAVKALPANLPDFIEINIDNLEMGKSVKVGEIKVEGVEILDSAANAIVTVSATRASRAAAAEADGKK